MDEHWKDTHKIEQHWQEADLDDVMRFFADSFKPRTPEEKILRYEFFIDTHRRKAVFKLTIEGPK